MILSLSLSLSLDGRMEIVADESFLPSLSLALVALRYNVVVRLLDGANRTNTRK